MFSRYGCQSAKLQRRLDGNGFGLRRIIIGLQSDPETVARAEEAGQA